jgi:hypothetical protein
MNKQINAMRFIWVNYHIIIFDIPEIRLYYAILFTFLTMIPGFGRSEVVQKITQTNAMRFYAHESSLTYGSVSKTGTPGEHQNSW